MFETFNALYYWKEIFYVFIAQLNIFTIAWVASIKLNDVSTCDIAWALGYTIQPMLYYFMTPGTSWYQLVFMVLSSIHGLRMAQYLGKRMIGNPEDRRLNYIRGKVGASFWWSSYFLLFLPQCFLSTLLGISYYVFNVERSTPICNIRYGVGIALITIGFIFNSIADEHLYIFRNNANNNGKILNSGLWKISRHPNYFGDTLYFWGTYILNCAMGIYFTVYVPIIMTVLLRFGTGVLLTEKFMAEKHKEEFDNWIKTTPIFFPWFPKKSGVENSSKKMIDETQ